MHYLAYCMLLFQCKVVKKKKGFLSQISPSPLTSGFPPPLCSSSEFHGIQGTLLPPNVAVHWYKTCWSGGTGGWGDGGVCTPLLSGKAGAWRNCCTLIVCQNTHRSEKRQLGRKERGPKGAQRGPKSKPRPVNSHTNTAQAHRTSLQMKLTAKTKLRTRPVPHFKSFWSTVSEN